MKRSQTQAMTIFFFGNSRIFLFKTQVNKRKLNFSMYLLCLIVNVAFFWCDCVWEKTFGSFFLSCSFDVMRVFGCPRCQLSPEDVHQGVKSGVRLLGCSGQG